MERKEGKSHRGGRGGKRRVQQVSDYSNYDIKCKEGGIYGHHPSLLTNTLLLSDSKNQNVCVRPAMSSMEEE